MRYTVRYEVQGAERTVVREFNGVEEKDLEGMRHAVRALIAKPGDTVLINVTGEGQA